MFPLEIWIGVALLGALIVYALSGGADFGVGVWDLFATGNRQDQQRVVIVRAIAPIWEVNQIWLVVVVVLLFTAFPLAFDALWAALFIPLAILIVGLVLRGVSFLIRAYMIQSEWAHWCWQQIFIVSSIVAAMMLGVCIGAVSSSNIRVQAKSGAVLADNFSAWWAPFPFAVGLLILAMFAFLAAVYLLHETEDEDLQEDFRLRALISGGAVFVLAWVSFYLAGEGAPFIREGLWHRLWSVPFQGMTGMMATSALVALWVRWYWSARILTVVQVVLMISGWGMAQFPFVIAPDLRFDNAAAPDSVLRPVLMTLGIGLLVLIPCFWYLYRMFKWQKETHIQMVEVGDEPEMVEVEEEE